MSATLTEQVAGTFARMTIRAIYEYLQSKEHRREFEEWYLKRYGTPYVWKKEMEEEPNVQY